MCQRRLQPELMDQAGLDAGKHCQALHGLERINFWSGSVRILWTPLYRLALSLRPQPLRILDIATGAGDLPAGLWRKAHRAGLEWRIEGWDISPVAVDYAHTRAARRGADVRFEVHDALFEPNSMRSSVRYSCTTRRGNIPGCCKMARAAGVVLVNDPHVVLGVCCWRVRRRGCCRSDSRSCRWSHRWKRDSP